MNTTRLTIGALTAVFALALHACNDASGLNALQFGSGGRRAGDGGAMCNTPNDCQNPMNECVVRTCTQGSCGVAFQPGGMPLVEQTPGDCHQVVCDGNGSTRSIVDDSDTPASGECTQGTCAMGTPGNADDPEGAPCGNAMTCDGHGHCSGCTTDTQCTAPDTCGGGAPGVPHVCGCTPKTKAACVATCDTMDDGCGGTVDCNDGKKDGTETDVDCGGASCPRCAQGWACTVESDCASGRCVDGVCCATTCSTCEACDLPGSVGTCQPVVAGTTTAVCTAGKACDGAGHCKLGVGKTCASSSDCAGTTCVDNVCCQTASCPSCQACNVAPNLGTCTEIPFNHPDNAGTCNGTLACDGDGGCRTALAQPCNDPLKCVSLVCSPILLCAQEATNGPCFSNLNCHSGVCAMGKCQ
jgi:hypothetical protein